MCGELASMLLCFPWDDHFAGLGLEGIRNPILSLPLSHGKMHFLASCYNTPAWKPTRNTNKGSG